MKNTTIKLLSFLLATMMLLSCVVSCANSGDDTSDTQGNASTEAATELDTVYVPDIETQNYDCEFVITGVGDIIVNALVEEEERGEPFADAIYERAINIQDKLGVEIIEVECGDWLAYAANIARTVQSGDDAYQLVSTHPYEGVMSLLTANAVYDYANLPSVNLDAPYWATEFMEGVKIGDKYLVGYNDFCLTTTHALLFNKRIMGDYGKVAPYDDVLNMSWTLDKMLALISDVSEDKNGDGKKDTGDIFGISGWGWTDIISFVTSTGLKIVDRDSTGSYQIAYDFNTEKTLSVLDKINKMFNADYAYFYSPVSNLPALSFEDDTTLFYTKQTIELPQLRGLNFKFGVLPYPMYDESQGVYKSLNWNGIMLIPASIKNVNMVSDVMELLPYYSADVKVAYYENLLGAKLADAPDDAKMLDVIWDSIVTDVGLLSANLNGMDPMVYLFPNLCVEGTDRYASKIKSSKRSANKKLAELYG